MSEWKECKLGDVVKLNYGKALKEQERINGDIPVFSSAGITGFHNKPHVESQGLIIGRKGTIGTVYYSSKPFCCIDTAYYILPDDKNYNFKFLYYLLQTLGFEELNEDSAVPGLNRDTAYSQQISLPPLPEQKAIAGVLSSLDDKIDLLQRQNKTLEGMAEALWRKMFIEDADETWLKGTLGDVASFHNGKSRPIQDTSGVIPIYGGNGILGFTNISNYENESIIIGRVGAYCGSLYIENKPVWITDNALLAKPLTENTSKFLFFLLRALQLNSFAEGSSHPLLTQTLLRAIEIDIPPIDKMVKYDEIISDYLIKTDFNKVQVESLSRIRDSILPKLMSGEVMVKL